MLVISPLFVLLLFSKTVCVWLYCGLKQYNGTSRRSTAQGNKAAIKQAKVGGSWKPY
jgi:hypothetical protein